MTPRRPLGPPRLLIPATSRRLPGLRDPLVPFGLARPLSLLSLLSLLGASGCMQDNSLSGSLGEVLSLESSRVEILQNAEALQISFLRNRGTSVDLVVQVGLSLLDVTLAPGVKVRLEGESSAGHPRTTVVHAPGGEPQRVLPRVRQGDLHLTVGGPIGQTMRGTFSMRFADTGGDIGFGRTLAGSFISSVGDAGFGELP